MEEKNMSKTLMAIASMFFVITLGISSFFVVSPSVEATDLEGPGYALIAAPSFGTSNHIAEAEDLRDYLLDRGWSDERIIFLADSTEKYVDGDATKTEIEDAIDEIALGSTQDDIVFIAILDHAQGDAQGNSYFRTGDPGDPTFMSDTEFAGWVDDIENFRTMVIYISCPYSGGFVEELEGDYRIVISDADVGQSYTEGEYSFYQALTETEADDDGDGKVSVEEAYRYMEDCMEVQNPVIYDYYESHVFL